MSISWQQVPLNECLADVNVITMHIVLRGKCQNQAKATGMRHWTKCIFKISNTVLIFSMHVLALHHEAHFTLIEFTVLALYLIVETGGEF